MCQQNEMFESMMCKQKNYIIRNEENVKDKLKITQLKK